MSTRFVPLTPRIGAKVGMARNEVLDPAFAGECLEALERYGVLLFPHIGFDDDEQVAFSKSLGEIIPIGPRRSDGTQEPVYKITLDPRENPSGAEYLKATIAWHIDGLFDHGPPPKATMLSARRLAAAGGHTEFCNTYAAYDDLSEADRRYYDTLRVLHSLEASHRSTNPNPGPEEQASWRAAEARRARSGRRGASEHPLVWRHRSGRKSLVLGTSVDHVVGIPEAESRALIDKLTAHATRPENVYRHEWRVGDLLVWDNCGVMHRATPYDASSGRLMHRTTLYGVERIEPVQGAPVPSWTAGRARARARTPVAGSGVHRMETYKARCHCGAVRFEVETDLADPLRCNCSFCVRRGAVVQMVPADRFRLIEGDGRLSRYGGREFSQHFFCRTCGIHAFTRIALGNEQSVAVNLGCMSGVDLDSIVPRAFDGAKLL